MSDQSQRSPSERSWSSIFGEPLVWAGSVCAPRPFFSLKRYPPLLRPLMLLVLAIVYPFLLGIVAFVVVAWVAWLALLWLLFLPIRLLMRVTRRGHFAPEEDDA